MRALIPSLIAAAVLTVLLVAPGPLSPVQRAAAWHEGAVKCYPQGGPVSDGTIAPGEYGENFFDGATKLLVFVSCDRSPSRLLHVGIVSPWSGWVGFLMQASDVWNGSVNEVRVSYASGALQVMDGYGNVSEGMTTPDSALGGSSDVMNATTGTTGAARVYEFTIPLRSSDRYDSQLQSLGPFYFALAYSASEADLTMQATAISEVHPISLETAGTPGGWTDLEFSLAPSSDPREKPTMLVSLRDDRGYPIPSTQVETFVGTAFGFFDAGPVVTNEQGVAQVTYVPRGSGRFLIGAAYTGGLGLLSSVAWRVLTVGSSAEGGDFQLGFGDGGTVELRPVEALIVVAVMSVWATYAYAFFVVRLSMRQPRTGAPSRDKQFSRWK